MNINPTDQAVWRHLTKATAFILSGKRHAAISEINQALKLLQS